MLRRPGSAHRVRTVVTAGWVVIVMGACAANPDAGASTGPFATPSPMTTSSAAQLRMVALGDSIAAGGRCECLPYPGVYGRLAAEALGQPVRVRNEAVNGATSADLLALLRRSDPLQSAVRDADIITITIGINDINRCGGEGDRACYEAGVSALQADLEAILSEIDTLQGDHPHILRATGYHNFMIGKPEAEEFGTTFQAFYAEQLAALNSTICSAVVAHDGLCVDLLPAFNGPAGDQDAGALLVFDHEHPTSEGHEIIAQEIAAVGYAPLAQ